ncbi:putative chromatin regulator PHD family [Helianthus annuus]|uniref:Chromatin regulator PHD family n=1 Tax=Helianthus annuus TaxID=4232 RepID=A0A9K3GUJ7_HELAN|nr:putative chromatin regulator PHD family [Helianthus annuus]
MVEEVMTDVKSDTQTENVETVQGDEEITEGRDDVDVEKLVGVTEVDDEGEPVEADEDKLVDTDVESDEEKAGAESPEQSVKTRGCRGKKRKRGGKTPQATPKSSGGGRKTVEEEDVCFMCYDGGDLVICDKRNCPKAYHPACINREEAFFQTKGRWNCGELFLHPFNTFSSFCNLQQ